MNIFLDTTVFYNNPYLNKSKSKRLREIAEDGKGLKLYVSEVVLQEAERHYEVRLRNINKEIKSFTEYLKLIPGNLEESLKLVNVKNQIDKNQNLTRDDIDTLLE